MPYAIGVKALRRLCLEQNPLQWQRAKLSPALFKPYEVPMFEWVNQHLKQFHTLPQIETLVANFPEVAAIETPEPSAYYVKLVENQYFHDVLDKANVESQAVLKENQDAHEKAAGILSEALKAITLQKYRAHVVDIKAEIKDLVLNHYHKSDLLESSTIFGWEYLDQQGAIMPGEVISIIGRPAAGKTFCSLWVAIQNWRAKTPQNVLFASMEMATLPISQRIAAMYSCTPIGQLKIKGFATPTLKKFENSMKSIIFEESKFYVIDGNLAANVDDIYILADMLECKTVVIDGAYLLKHKNFKLDKFTKVSENAEAIKRYSLETDSVSFCSWQFNRKASEKQKKTEDAGLEDIGLSDSIGQISSVVLGLFETEGIDTSNKRRVKVLKGRNGEIGEFLINWNFMSMNFSAIEEEGPDVKLWQL